MGYENGCPDLPASSGGVSVSGGEGTISNVIVGVLMIGVLSNGLVIMGLSEYYQLLIKGLVLLFAVGFDSVQKLSQSRVKKNRLRRIRHVIFFPETSARRR